MCTRNKAPIDGPLRMAEEACTNSPRRPARATAASALAGPGPDSERNFRVPDGVQARHVSVFRRLQLVISPHKMYLAGLGALGLLPPHVLKSAQTKPLNLLASGSKSRACPDSVSALPP